MEIRKSSQFENGYIFRKEEIQKALSQKYLGFLKEAGIADITKTPNLFVASHLLKRDKDVEKAVRKLEVSCSYENDGTVVNISQPYARNLVYELGGIVLPTGIIYKLFIPELKHAAGEGNESAISTLEEMTGRYAEWLEDLILNKSRLKIGNQERTITLPNKDGRFDRTDINEFGYPTQVKSSGEFYCLVPRGDKSAAIRYWDSELGLNLDWVPSFEVDWLGVRFANFFS